MIYQINETHDPSLTSWVESANKATTEFPIQNLPFGVFRKSESVPARVGVAIGDQILDVTSCRALGLFSGLADTSALACESPSLNALMAWGPKYWTALRQRVSGLLRAGAADTDLTTRCLVPMTEVEMLVPAAIRNYTDFYASIHHATNIGKMLRPENPLLPNYKHVPIAYHGRASSIVVGGTPIRRPKGQIKQTNAGKPEMLSTRMLDYELEVGCFIGEGNALGEPVRIANAEQHLFGLCLVNDWSARDIQSWEYQPLGPFLAKNFSTSVSPWIVTMEALAPFRVSPAPRSKEDPPVLPYLGGLEDKSSGAVNITLQVMLLTKTMRNEGLDPIRLSEANFKDMYWTFAQMVAHHSINGCNLQSGDMIASGTVSGPDRISGGCLMELTWRGTEPLTLRNGETRKFLEDGDEVIMRGFCQSGAHKRIGFGECRGLIVPAIL